MQRLRYHNLDGGLSIQTGPEKPQKPVHSVLSTNKCDGTQTEIKCLVIKEMIRRGLSEGEEKQK
jgi:hypothetical protein